MAYGVIRTDLMTGTDVGAGLVSLRFNTESDGAYTPAAIENGNVVKLVKIEEDNREVWVAVAPTATDSLADCAIVAGVELMYDERKKNLDEYINEAGKATRGYRFHQNDMFGVTKDCLDGVSEPAVGDIVELKAGTKFNVAKSATGGSTQVGKIAAIEVAGRYTYYVIKEA